MNESFVQQQLCNKLDTFSTLKNPKNTIYRKFVNWDGESRWTLIYEIFIALQSCADYVNSQVPIDVLTLDSLPARYMCSEKFKKHQQEQGVQKLATGSQKTLSTESKKKQKSKTDSQVASVQQNEQSIAQEAILVAKNVDRVLSMKALHGSLTNLKSAIAQFCNKERYKNDEVAIALFFSLLNSANRIALRIESYLNELKAM